MTHFYRVDIGDYPDLIRKAVVTENQNWCASGRIDYDITNGKYTAAVPYSGPTPDPDFSKITDHSQYVSVLYGENVCWNGQIGPDPSNNPIYNSGSYFYFYGALESKKNIDTNLEALKQARQIQHNILDLPHKLNSLVTISPTLPSLIDQSEPFVFLPNTIYTFGSDHIPGEGLTICSTIRFYIPDGYPASMAYYYIFLGDLPNSQNPSPVLENLLFQESTNFTGNVPYVMLDPGVLPRNIFIVTSGNIINNYQNYENPIQYPSLILYGNMISFGFDKNNLYGNALPGTKSNPGVYNNSVSYLAANTHLLGRMICCSSPLVIDIGSVIEIEPPGVICYARGTEILTKNGNVKVEDLKLGMEIVTVGSINKNVLVSKITSYHKLLWVSSFKVSNMTEDVYPVCIKKNTFSKDVPFKDLYISQDHSILINNRMVSGKELCNGTNIFKDKTVKNIEYFHIELENHSVVLANGVLSESFLANEERKSIFKEAPKLPGKPNKKSFKMLRL